MKMYNDSGLRAKLQHDFLRYTPSLKSENTEDVHWAISVLGKKYFVDVETIPEILEKLEFSYHSEHHWFVKSINSLEFYIRYAFYNGMYDEDDLGSFLYNFYNEKIILSVINDRTKSETIFDGVWDLYVKVLTELKYAY